MSTDLVVHRGGWDSTTSDLASIAVPDSTDSYVPVPYGRLVEEVKLHVPRFGLNVIEERYALAREGNQMFGVLSCRNGHDAQDWCLAIGIRSSYDRSLAVGLVAGSHVFVCDNLAFHGESGVSRKHTVNVFRDLPNLIYRMLSQVAVLKARTDAEIAGMKALPMPPERAHHLMIEAIKGNIMPASRLPKVIEAWEQPRHEVFRPRTAWSLFNSFTEALKNGAPRQQIDGSLRLSLLFRKELPQA